MQIGMYLNIYYVASGDQKLASTVQGIAGSCYQVTSILAIPVVSWLGTRLGKRRALMSILGLGVCGSLSAWFLVTPTMPYLQIASLFFTAPAISGLWILAPSMIADVCDYDEDLSGKRREGMFGAAYGWFTKVGGSAALLTSGFVLTWTGFDVDLGAAQSGQTITLMRGLNAFVPALAFSVAILCIFKYPITAEVAEQIRGRIEKKPTEDRG
jgi:glycoside/pentoside/hexuronide:cation symporter, GPH family